ncbi:AcrR family transcriptional regulator [Kutzneria viridogrisea]|nr:TetR/AcrR family transcriptional regulator [Kutzneria albida]MBA8925113.1 AcrR family transcriptional regulator [Kutzneria viridogrisea]
MPSKTEPESSTRSRTRRAILDAALELLSQRPGTSLGEIAEAAGVGRSTLHRYFSERSELIAAIAGDAVDKLTSGVAEAALNQGTPVEALRRVVHVYFEFGPVLLFLVSEPQVSTEIVTGIETADVPVLELIQRGQREGYFDSSVSAQWISRVLGWMVHAGSESVREGELTRFEAVETVIRTLERGVVSAG